MNESSINIIAEGTRLEGKVELKQISRVYGEVIGQLVSPSGGKLILGETSVVEGTIEAEELLIDGFVRGDIRATRRVTISRTGRVIGKIETPSLQLEPGAYFEGQCRMENLTANP